MDRKNDKCAQACAAILRLRKRNSSSMITLLKVVSLKGKRAINTLGNSNSTTGMLAAVGVFQYCSGGELTLTEDYSRK